MDPDALIELAESLSDTDMPASSEVALRRAVSTTYYALFHSLAASCADSLAGGSQADRASAAWHQVYRALEHTHARNQCRDRRIADFPESIRRFAERFAVMQVKRHRADYDPREAPDANLVRTDIQRAKHAIAAFRATPARERRDFAAFVLLKTRRD